MQENENSHPGEVADSRDASQIMLRTLLQILE